MCIGQDVIDSYFILFWFRLYHGDISWGYRTCDTRYKEVNLFVSGGEKTSALLDIHSCLKTIPPTSVEAERVFSVTGLFLTKLRTRLSDVTLDKLIFLKYYFLNKA